MRMDAGLHRLVVIGHHREHRIGAGGLGPPRQLDGLAGRIRSGAGNDADAAVCDLDGGAEDTVVLGRCQRGGFAGGFADHDRRDAGLDLALTKSCECRQIEFTVLIEGRGKIGDVTRQPCGGMCAVFHRISRCVFHLGEALPVG